MEEGKMNLVIDQGNTRTKVAVFDAYEIQSRQVLNSDDLHALDQMIQDFPQLTGAIYSSVAPHEPTKDYLQARFPNLLLLNHQTPLPITNNYQTPQTLGMDRIAGVVGAQGRNPNKPSLVIDAGTAITYDFINEQGVYEGGGISLGLKMRFEALHALTSQLPYVELSEDEREKKIHLGKNTRDSINFGVTNGMLYEVDGQIRYFKQHYPELSVFFTGGDLRYFEKIINCSIFAVPFLAEEGLNRILIHYEGKV